MYEMYPEWGPTWRDSDADDRAEAGSVTVREHDRLAGRAGTADNADTADNGRPPRRRDTDARA
jgi:hypothetical protein